MGCRILTVWYDKEIFIDRKYTIACAHENMKWVSKTLLYQTGLKTPLVKKGLKPIEHRTDKAP